LYVKCVFVGSFESCNNFYELRTVEEGAKLEVRLKAKLAALGQMTHAAWGDVEGNKTFLNGCQAHLAHMIQEGYVNHAPTIVCMGDVVGPANPGNLASHIDEAYCITWALQTSVKLIGNRDYNKLRLILEYEYWDLLKNKPTIEEIKKKETYRDKTLPFKLDEKEDGSWVYGGGVPATPNITSVFDAFPQQLQTV